MRVSLRVKILGIVLLPALVIGISAIVISNINVTDVMEKEMIKQLKTSAYSGREFYEKINNEVFSFDEDGNLKKGEFIITGNYSLVDTIRSSGNIYATFFYGDERIVTNVLDENGKRMIGTKASDAVVQAVLVKGEDYFSKDVKIGGEQYYGYYVPVRQSGTGEVIGMFFTGDSVAKIAAAVDNVSSSIKYIIIVILIVSVLVASIIVYSITTVIKRSINVLDKLADGELKVDINNKDLKKNDETGDIVRSNLKLRNTLTSLISDINNTAETLFSTSKDIDEVVGITKQNTIKIDRSIDDLSNSSSSQAMSVDGVSEQINIMGNSIQNTTLSVSQLHENTIKIKELSENVTNILGKLSDDNVNVMNSVEIVYENINLTNEYVNKIASVLEVIQNIVDETNMLSLNASIEAARAGEAGRGFTIVAQQVKSLAEESNDSTKQIEKIIKTLKDTSNKAVDSMVSVKNIIGSQSKSLKDTMDSFEIVHTNIKRSNDKVSDISDMAKEIDYARTEVINLVSELSVISEENADNTKHTSNAVNELAAAMQNIEKEVKQLNDLAESLSQDVKQFKL